MNTLLNAREVGEILGINITTVYKWRDKGFIKPVRVTPTGYQYYSYDEIMKFSKSLNVSDKEGM